jgi:hypothetical protein
VPVGVAALRVGGALAPSASSSRQWGCSQTDSRLPDGSGLSSAAWAGGGGGGCVISGLRAKALSSAHLNQDLSFSTRRLPTKYMQLCVACQATNLLTHLHAGFTV